MACEIYSLDGTIFKTEHQLPSIYCIIVIFAQSAPTVANLHFEKQLKMQVYLYIRVNFRAPIFQVEEHAHLLAHDCAKINTIH